MYERAYHSYVEYEWDEVKAHADAGKHGVDFADAIGVFDDPLALTHPDPRAAESRSVTLGQDHLGRILVVVYTWRGSCLRIISARRATPRERRTYEG